MISQTISFTDFVAYRHGKHNVRLGLDIRRVHADSIGGNDPLGSYTFTGYATGSRRKSHGKRDDYGVGVCGFSAGAAAEYLDPGRAVQDLPAGERLCWYVNDDFRLAANFTMNYGLRYEYFAPYREKYNRLANLDHNADFSEEDPVQPGQTGEFQGKFPSGLIDPDRTMFAPRFGLAWRPKSESKWTKQTVVRAGYGINYNTGEFATMAESLSFQPPFAETQTNVFRWRARRIRPAPTGCVTTTPDSTANMTLANGFGCSTARRFRIAIRRTNIIGWGWCRRTT